jgi:hypothetical protein
VKHFLAILFAFWPVLATAAPLVAAQSTQTPHPAIVRVIAADQSGASMGTGVLVANDDAHGLIVTNWHVVRDATGPITVVFPDGFRSGALLLKTDRDWDLAALAIQRPQAAPLPIAAEAPRPGESLAIAGYGPEGIYRVVGGRCVKYHSPGGNLPYEILEVDVEARRGDSGGPIYNSRGEVAGILFGAAGNMWFGGYTMGSYCGRVRLFLAGAYVDFQRLPRSAAMVAQAPAPLPVLATGAARTPPQSPSFPSSSGQSLPETPGLPAGGLASCPPLQPVTRTSPLGASSSTGGNLPSSPARVPSTSSSPIAQVSSAAAAPRAEPLPSRADQVKTVLAVIGIAAILFHGIKLVGSSVG